MQEKLLSYPGLAVFVDLYFDRVIYATLIGAALFSGLVVHGI